MSTNQESLIRTYPEDLTEVIEQQRRTISTLRMECRDLARELAEAKPADSIVIPRSDLPEVTPVDSHGTVDVDGYFMVIDIDTADEHRRIALRNLALAEYLDAQEPRPLTVGDRVRVVVPENGDGVRDVVLAVGDEGTVTAEADEDGDILFRRDGTEAGRYLAAANVERIEDER